MSNRKIICFLICILSFLNVFSQKLSEFNKGLSVSFGSIVYNENIFTNQALENRRGRTINFKGYYFKNNKYFIKLYDTYTLAELNKDIEINKNVFYKGDHFRFTTYAFCYGYSHNFLKFFEIGIYSGILFNEYALKKMAQEINIIKISSECQLVLT